MAAPLGGLSGEGRGSGCLRRMDGRRKGGETEVTDGTGRDEETNDAAKQGDCGARAVITRGTHATPRHVFTSS